MRIVAGSLRGRVLAPPAAGVRPTSDRVREALFARLGNLAGLCVLDLFAGTGAVGIEALSRGAERLVSVDRSRRSMSVIRKNLDSLQLESQVQTLCCPALGALRRLAQRGNRFDLVFLDPPYEDTDCVPEILARLLDVDLLNPGAVVVVEGPKRHSLPPIAGYEVEGRRPYGDTVITWFYAAGEGIHSGGEEQNEQ